MFYGDNSDFSNVKKWLNLESTKEALGVDLKHSHAWNSCNFGINAKFHSDWMKTFAPFVSDLLNAGIPALIYAGDVDFICNYVCFHFVSYFKTRGFCPFAHHFSRFFNSLATRPGHSSSTGRARTNSMQLKNTNGKELVWLVRLKV